MTRDGHVKCTMLASLSKILKPLHGFDYGIFFFKLFKIALPPRKEQSFVGRFSTRAVSPQSTVDILFTMDILRYYGGALNRLVRDALPTLSSHRNPAVHDVLRQCAVGKGGGGGGGLLRQV